MKGQILHESTYMKYLQQANPQRQKVGQRLSEAGGKGNGELLLNGYRVSIWDHEKFEIDNGGGCITL